jgi:hypothetical protein
MIQEKINIKKKRPDEPPEGFGLTLITYSKDKSPKSLLSMIRSVWEVVATWGRWCDDELGEWPTLDECISSLPIFFQKSVKLYPEEEIENWLDDLHDRQWIWWSSTEIESGVKIDLVTDSMPVSTWPLEFVVTISGGLIVYKDIWIDSIKSGDILKKFRVKI